MEGGSFLAGILILGGRRWSIIAPVVEAAVFRSCRRHGDMRTMDGIGAAGGLSWRWMLLRDYRKLVGGLDSRAREPVRRLTVALHVFERGHESN